MKAILIFSILALSAAAQAQEGSPNPDAGRHMQMLCFEVHADGTQNPNFAVVLQQTDISEYDASYFVPGNDNFETWFTGLVDAELFVYKDVPTIIGQDEGEEVEFDRELAEQLLQSNSAMPQDGYLDRQEKRIGFSWDNRVNRMLFRFDRHELSEYRDVRIGDHRDIECETPWSVP